MRCRKLGSGVSPFYGFFGFLRSPSLTYRWSRLIPTGNSAAEREISEVHPRGNCPGLLRGPETGVDTRCEWNTPDGDIDASKRIPMALSACEDLPPFVSTGKLYPEAIFKLGCVSASPVEWHGDWNDPSLGVDIELPEGRRKVIHAVAITL